MTKIDLTRRDFLIAGAGAAAGFITASLIGCSSGGNSGGVVWNSSDTGVQDSSYEGQRGITAFYLTTNSSLYRQILPTAFDMPDNLAVVVTVVFYYNVTAPLVPYHEGYVMLMCKYQGQDCLYTVTMPVDDQYACDGGRQLGFPKYMADRIELTNNGGLWDGRVIYQGRTILQMNFTPSGDATV